MRHHPLRRLLVVAAFLLLRNGDLGPGWQPKVWAAESTTGRPSVVLESDTAFLLPIPADFAGVESVRAEGNGWVLQETRGADGSGRTFSIGR